MKNKSSFADVQTEQEVNQNLLKKIVSNNDAQLFFVPNNDATAIFCP